MVLTADQVQSFLALGFGIAVAGLCATGYQLATHRPASFRILDRGPCTKSFAAVPLLAFAAPFIIMRISLLAQRQRRRFESVMLATIVAGIWSMMSGTVVVMALQAAGF